MKKVLLLLTLLTFVGCQDKGTTISPSMEGFDVPTPNSPSNGDSTVSVAPVDAPALSECALIGITARRVLGVSPGSVTLLVTASYSGPGTPYVRIIDAASGASLGDYPLGTITLSRGAGPHRLFIFVEVDNNGVIQCDGSLSFVIPAAPTPPTPPMPPPPIDPPCADCNPLPPPPPVQVCGNGAVEVPEECDDGNLLDGDGCSSVCVTDPPPPPEHGICVYEVKGGKSKKESRCEHEGGVFEWIDGSDHCVFDFPGISHKDFNLTPGQSDEDCLRKPKGKSVK